MKTRGQTGVEMEALTAVSIACLTIYDMAKAADRGMRIEGVRLLEKSGGKSGEWRAGGEGAMNGGMISVAEALARVLASAPRGCRRRARGDRGRARPHACRGSARAAHAAALRQFRNGWLRLARRRHRTRAGEAERDRANRRPDAPSTARSGRGEAVRIFTGAPMPDGADAVLIQENAERDGDVAHRQNQRSAAAQRSRSRHRLCRGRTAAAGGQAPEPARFGAGGGGQPPARRRAPAPARRGAGDRR